MDLSKDIVIEILSLLPVKSLLRFRSVSKSWHNIIDSSTFTYFHLKNRLRQDDDTLFLQFSKSSASQLSILEADNEKSHKGFPAFQKFINDNFVSDKVTNSLFVVPVNGLPSMYNKTQLIRYKHLPGKIFTGKYNPCLDKMYLFVVGPVNGLICMYNKIPYIRSKRSSTLSIAIYNPCLDKIKILPESPICSSLGLKYGKKNCNRDIGFGFDPVTKEYKVVQLIIFPELGATCVEVYSAKTNTWRKLATGSSLFIDRIEGIKSKSGSWAHWRVELKTGQCILSFNMETEVFETVSYPDFDVRSSVVFAKDNDSFALFVSNFECCRLEVWELESGEWIHVSDVNVEPIMAGCNPMSPISLWKGDEGLVLMESGHTERNLIFYDNSTESVRFCCEIPNVDTEMVHYTGSLISP